MGVAIYRLHQLKHVCQFPPKTLFWYDLFANGCFESIIMANPFEKFRIAF